MEIDNFDLIIPMLEFDNSDYFYYLQILQRKKENEQLGSNSRVIRNYYIKSIEHLLLRKNEIIKTCNTFNARAMFRLNRRSFEKVSFKAIQNIANSIANREFEFCNKSYDRACGNGHIEKRAKWIIDIDEIGRQVNDMILFIERQCEPICEKYINIIPSKNGFHIITYPFDVQYFKKSYDNIEIHKDNPTNLYIP